MIPMHHPDTRIDTFANAWAEQLIAEMDRSGIVLSASNNRTLIAHLSQSLLRVSRQREKEAREQFAQWVQAENLLSAEDTTKRLDISLKTLQRACSLGLIQAEVPSVAIQQHAAFLGINAFGWFDATLVLTADDLKIISRRNVLNRTQAAQRLQITVRAFEQLREQHHLQAIETFTTNFGTEGHLYRLEDVESLLSYVHVPE